MFQYIQHTPFFNKHLSSDLLGVLSVRGLSAVTDAFENSVLKNELKRIFNVLDQEDFSHLQVFADYRNMNKVSLLALERVIFLLPNFSKKNNAYGSDEEKRKMFLRLLELLSAIEADIILRLVLKKYDVEAVRQYLNPELTQETPKKPRRKKKIDENSLEINELPENESEDN